MSNSNDLPVMMRNQLLDLINYKNKENIQEIVSQVYNDVINHDKHSIDTVYQYEIPKIFLINKFYIENINKII